MSNSSTKPANVLARKYEVGTTKEEFFEYIVLSDENGQSKQMHDLFNQMDMADKEMFLLYCQQGEFIDIIRQIAVRNL
jgi:hypothetical protein